LKFLVKVIFLLVVDSLISTKAFCAENDPITLLSGISRPPFIIAEDNKGMQIEIIKAAFAYSNTQVNFMYFPMIRQVEVYKKRNIEGLITLSENDNELGLYLSKPYISYENVVITLASNNFDINKISDLSKVSVAAFQSASKFFGDKFNYIFEDSSSYVEVENQKSQLALLFTKRVDAIVIDINIFKHLLILMRKENNNLYNEEVVVHQLFEKADYVAGFTEEKHQKDFDKGIAEIKTNGNYQKIIDSYLELKKNN
jgi:polar amino acid transport system substrate-binding protein